MKKLSGSILILLAGMALHGGVPTANELLSYEPVQEKTLVYGTGFEDPNDKSITLGEGSRYAKGEGNNGNTALRIDRVGAVSRVLDSTVALPPGKIKPGYKYRVVVNVKGKGVRHAVRPIPPTSYRFMETYYKDKKGNMSTFWKNRIVPFAVPPKEDVRLNLRMEVKSEEPQEGHLM